MFNDVPAVGVCSVPAQVQLVVVVVDLVLNYLSLQVLAVHGPPAVVVDDMVHMVGCLGRN